MTPFQDVKCVRSGTKGIHTETFVTQEAYLSMQNSNAMNLWFLNTLLQDCQNSLMREKSNISRNLCEKYFEICNLLLEYVNLFSQQNSYEEKLVKTIDRILNYLREDSENTNVAALKDIVTFIYSLIYTLSLFFNWNEKFSNRLEVIYNFARDYDILTQHEFDILKSDMQKCLKGCNFQQIQFFNPVTEYSICGAADGRV